MVGVLARAKKPVGSVSCISIRGIAPYDTIHDVVTAVAAAITVAVGCVGGVFDVSVAVTIVVVAVAIVSV